MNVGIAAWTCHQPSSVFDVVPGDLVSSSILAAAAATTQASTWHAMARSCSPLAVFLLRYVMPCYYIVCFLVGFVASGVGTLLDYSRLVHMHYLMQSRVLA